MQKVDVIVIGSGQGGVPFATQMADRGKKVVLFERNRFGGSCANWGCTPSKSFLAAANGAGRAREAESLGLKIHVEVDFQAVMNRVRRIRDSFSKGIEHKLKESGVQMIQAEASFRGQGVVQDGDHQFTAPLVVIDTGSSPMIPPIPGMQSVDCLTYCNFWEIQELPPRVLVLGGGYVGLELGQGLARLGSAVSIIDTNERVLHQESPQVSEVIQKALEKDGIRFYLGETVEKAWQEGNAVRLHLRGDKTLQGDALLVATGTRPNTEALNAQAAGIDLDAHGYIKVDEHFKTTSPGVYAIGEVAGQPAFTHVSWEDHRRLLAILSGKDRTRDDRVLGYAVFTEPQMARAGLSFEQAKEKGIRAKAARMEAGDMARAIEWGQETGFYEMTVDEDTDRIIGATMVGYEVSELVHIVLDLIEAGATWKFLGDIQHIHPTYAESLPTLARMFHPR